MAGEKQQGDPFVSREEANAQVRAEIVNAPLVPLREIVGGPPQTENLHVSNPGAPEAKQFSTRDGKEITKKK